MCGVVGVWGHPEAANLAYLGLHALQHRGQEGAGIVSCDGHRLHTKKGHGLVADVFRGRRHLARLPGRRAIGHVRYSTTGASDESNVGPVVACWGGGLAIAHNGNLVNAASLREELEEEGALFQSTSDTEVLTHLVARSRQRSFLNRVVDALGRVRGAWSLLMLTPEMMIAGRDPNGFRPLVLGRRKASGAWVVASETTALDLIDADFTREITPGELVVIDDSGLTSFHPFPKAGPSPCVFEHLYFARPDTMLWGQDVYSVRHRVGEQLAREQPAEVDLVTPVPDSGTTAALGFARTLEVPFELALVRSHYVGRTFIEPNQQIRDFGVKLKLNPVPGMLDGKRIAVVDDSLVRGTTCAKIVRMLRRAGASEVHLRIAAPPIIAPCWYGIDTPTREELAACRMEVSEIGRFVGADSIGYLSVEGMHEAVAAGGTPEGGWCDACFTGRYPVLHDDLARRPQLRLFESG